MPLLNGGAPASRERPASITSLAPPLHGRRDGRGSTTPEAADSTARAAHGMPGGLASSLQPAARHLTPGITRRAFNAATAKFSMTSELTRGRVHAVVRFRRGLIAGYL